MTDKNLEKVMRKEWQNARRVYHYPQLPHPKLVDDVPNGSIDMESLETRVSEPFIKGFKEHGIEEDEAMNEVLTHELTHFMRYPGSVLNVLKLQKAARNVVQGERASELRRSFTEAQTNLHMLLERKHPATAKMRKAYGLDEGDTIGRIEYGLYQELSGQDLGVELTKEEQAVVDRIKDIQYLNKKHEGRNFRRFAEVLKDYKPESQQQQGKDGQPQDGSGQEEGKGQGQGRGKPQYQESGLDMFSDNEIREGIRQFAQECSSPEEFEEIVREVLTEGREGDEKKESRSSSHYTAGTERGIPILARNFYTALAANYIIPIRRRDLHKNGSLYPHSHTEFSVSDSIADVDPFSAPGIMPGVTKKWVRKEGEVHSDFEGVPDSIIVLDSSESMPNPEEGISVPVLGATAISNAYLDNGADVSVYNFSADDIVMGPSRNKERIHRTLRTYQNGGTRFNAERVRGLLKDEEKVDIAVISDMEIHNLDGFINYMLSVPQTHRVHLLYTGSGRCKEYVDTLREKFGNRDNVAILPLITQRDIPQITMGELKKSVH